ncbi:MAG: urate hydroxylase PuuD [Alphaproteobacteria bacterium]
MAGILTSLQRTIVAGFILTALLFALLINSDGHNLALKDVGSWSFFFRWLHVISGVMWIGILWYFNFVQIPNMGNIPDDQKPAISKVIAPAALWWFRWGAMATIVTGLVLAHLNGYLGDALSLGYVGGFMVGKNIAIGIGMWLGIIMFINVWFIIWPNQKIALGIVDGSADEKAAAGRKAMLFSRTNTMLSIPMLFAMVSAQNIYGA